MTTCKAGKFVKLLVFLEFDNKKNTKKPLHVVKKAQRLPWLETIQGPIKGGVNMKESGWWRIGGWISHDRLFFDLFIKHQWSHVIDHPHEFCSSLQPAWRASTHILISKNCR